MVDGDNNDARSSVVHMALSHMVQLFGVCAHTVWITRLCRIVDEISYSELNLLLL